MEMEFISNQETKHLHTTITAQINGTEYELPAIDKNGCHHVKSCPLTKDHKYSYEHELIVPKVYPSKNTTLKAVMNGDHGVVTCIKFNIEIEDKKIIN